MGGPQSIAEQSGWWQLVFNQNFKQCEKHAHSDGFQADTSATRTLAALMDNLKGTAISGICRIPHCLPSGNIL